MIDWAVVKIQRAPVESSLASSEGKQENNVNGEKSI